ncbi:MAG: 1-acyl-sn-glycerol-3-phosphate acyltransferase [Acidimicrobiales bacterium]|jgi:1-acyl-sn-glycerol-3-phosphate acyltransferase
MVVPIGREDQGGRGILAPLTESIGHRITAERNGAVLARDPDFVRRFVAQIEQWMRYFSPEVRGIEHLPLTGPVLVISNHSCVFYMPDTWMVGAAITERRGAELPAYALVYDLLFGIPGVGSMLRRLGAVPASDGEGERLLAEGALILDYPGGDAEACRPWAERDRIVFSGHMGFVRLALRAGVPVVPVVAYGSHHAVVVLSRGETLARVLGLDRLRIKVFPILLGPLGVTSVLAPPLPMPAEVTVEFMPPMDWSALGPGAADDDDVVRGCYEEITGAMQATLDRLRAEKPHPVLRGWSHLLRQGGRPMEFGSE